MAEGHRLRAGAANWALSELQWATEDDQTPGFHKAVAGVVHSQWIEMEEGADGHFAGAPPPSMGAGIPRLPGRRAERADRPAR